MSRAVAAAAAVALGSTIIGCNADRGPGPAGPRTIVSVATAANPTDALSSLVTYMAPGSDSARVRYWSDSDQAAQTPFVPSSGGSGTVPVLGLRPQSLYQAVLGG